MNSYIELSEEQIGKIKSNIGITDLLNNINDFIVGVMNYFQSNGSNLEPFYSESITKLTLENTDYRKVIYTGPNQQFVIMNIKPKDDIHMEIHENHDQFIKIEKGTGIATIGGTEYLLKKEVGIIVPAGTKHRILNTSDTEELKLYTIYSPAEHPPNLIEVENLNTTINDNISIEQTEKNDSEHTNNSNLESTEKNESEHTDNSNNDAKYKEKYLEYKNKYITLKKFYSNFL